MLLNRWKTEALAREGDGSIVNALPSAGISVGLVALEIQKAGRSNRERQR